VTGVQTCALPIFALPDSNLLNHTVVTAPFAENQTLFNDRPPAAPTRTWSNFYAGAPIASPNPHPGQPCPFGFVALSCDTPNLGSALIYMRNQYTQQWNFSVQREIVQRVAVTVAYVGNRTVRLQFAGRNNDPNPGPGDIQSRRPYPQWGPDTFAQWGGKADYHGLQNQVEVRDWNGLTMIGSYVFSKCLDSGTDEGSPYTSQLNGKDFAPCAFDARHTGSISFGYELPFGKGKRFLSGASGAVRQIAGGWRLSSVTTLKSGFPFTPTINGDRANIGVSSQRPNIIEQPLVPGDLSCWFYTSSNPTCKALFPNATDSMLVPAQYTLGNGGRNILRGDNLLQVDVSALKQFPITESKRLEFRAEFFNVGNHPVFAAPVTNVNQASGGQVSATANSNRIIEFALKVYF